MAIILKNRKEDATLPVPGNLEEGEVAINFVSQKIYTKNDAAAIIELGGHYAITAGTGLSITDSGYVDAEPTISADAATDTASGIVELATQDEVNTGTDTSKVVTCETLEGKAIDAATVDGLSIEVITQSDYDDLSPPNGSTLYFISG